MDITPQLLKDIRLSDAFRGYNKDEVDELIERVGAAIVQLQGRLREAVERAETAESRSLAGGGMRSESEETLRRTLVLAQRTADAAIAEANADAQRTIAEADDYAQRTTAEADELAQRTLADARAEAHRTVSDANEHAARTITEANERASRLLADTESHASTLRAETEAEVRRIAEESRAPLMDDIRELERVRHFLRDDIELLERHLQVQRERLRLHVSELTRIVEEPSTLRLEPLPATSGVDVASVLERDPVATIAPASASVAPAFAPPVGAPADEEADELDDEYDDDDLGADAFDDDAFDDDDFGDDTADETLDVADHDHDDRDEVAPRPAPHLEAGLSAPPAPPAGTLGAPSWADDSADELATLAHRPVPADLDGGGDQFLDQLRRAVDDEAGIDDGAMSDFFDAEVDEGPRSRFGRRR